MPNISYATFNGCNAQNQCVPMADSNKNALLCNPDAVEGAPYSCYKYGCNAQNQCVLVPISSNLPSCDKTAAPGRDGSCYHTACGANFTCKLVGGAKNIYGNECSDPDATIFGRNVSCYEFGCKSGGTCEKVALGSGLTKCDKNAEPGQEGSCMRYGCNAQDKCELVSVDKKFSYCNPNAKVGDASSCMRYGCTGKGECLEVPADSGFPSCDPGASVGFGGSCKKYGCNNEGQCVEVLATDKVPSCETSAKPGEKGSCMQYGCNEQNQCVLTFTTKNLPFCNPSAAAGKDGSCYHTACGSDLECELIGGAPSVYENECSYGSDSSYVIGKNVSCYRYGCSANSTCEKVSLTSKTQKCAKNAEPGEEGSCVRYGCNAQNQCVQVPIDSKLPECNPESIENTCTRYGCNALNQCVQVSISSKLPLCNPNVIGGREGSCYHTACSSNLTCLLVSGSQSIYGNECSIDEVGIDGKKAACYKYGCNAQNQCVQVSISSKLASCNQDAKEGEDGSCYKYGCNAQNQCVKVPLSSKLPGCSGLALAGGCTRYGCNALNQCVQVPITSKLPECNPNVLGGQDGSCYHTACGSDFTCRLVSGSQSIYGNECSIDEVGIEGKKSVCYKYGCNVKNECAKVSLKSTLSDCDPTVTKAGGEGSCMKYGCNAQNQCVQVPATSKLASCSPNAEAGSEGSCYKYGCNTLKKCVQVPVSSKLASCDIKNLDMDCCKSTNTRHCGSDDNIYTYDTCGNEKLAEKCSEGQKCRNNKCVQCGVAKDCIASGVDDWNCNSNSCTKGPYKKSQYDQYQLTDKYFCYENKCSYSQDSTPIVGDNSGGSVACSSSSNCGASGYVGDASCNEGNVYRNYRTYTCNNAGSTSSSCTSSVEPKLVKSCETNQTCSNGDCVSSGTISCKSSSDCGTSGYQGDPFCSNGDVYKKYITYACNNAGSTSSSCSAPTSDKMTEDCTSNQTCSNGACVTAGTISCKSSSDCGTSGYQGDPFCSNGDVYKKYITYTCNNAGTTSSSCANSVTNKRITDCPSTQTCSNGACVNAVITCSSSSSCGSSTYIDSPYCQDGNVYQDYVTFTCLNAGTTSSSCVSSVAPKQKIACSASQACADGACASTCTSHSSKKCYNNSVYWYDSCENQQEVYQTCSSNQTCSAGVCNNTSVGCTTNSNCGATGYVGSAYCDAKGDAVRKYVYNFCRDGVCERSTSVNVIEDCNSSQTCSNGACASKCSTECGWQGFTDSSTYFTTLTFYDGDDCYFGSAQPDGGVTFKAVGNGQAVATSVTGNYTQRHSVGSYISTSDYRPPNIDSNTHGHWTPDAGCGNPDGSRIYADLSGQCQPCSQ